MKKKYSLISIESSNDNTKLLKRICGIDKNYITNYDKFKLLIDEIICPICLKILLNPIECNKCQTIICENCFFILKFACKKCVKDNCDGIYTRANRFTREILGKLEINCFACEARNLSYNEYLEHIKKCDNYLSSPILIKIEEINKKDETIFKLKKKLSSIIKSTNNQNIILSDDELRKRYLTNQLTTEQKMDFFEAVVDNDLETYKKYIIGGKNQKKYNIFEEVSSKGYGWTTFHYAMHHGKWKIIKFIMEYLQSKGLLSIGMSLKSKDGRCPLLCLLKSNDIKIDVKTDVFIKIIHNFQIQISDKVKDELNKKNLTYVLEGYINENK